MPVTDRALFHLDNAYYIPHVEFSGQAMKTNVASNTAFRGFAAQGMLVIEEIIDRSRGGCGKSPETSVNLNLYHGTPCSTRRSSHRLPAEFDVRNVIGIVQMEQRAVGDRH